MNRSSFLNVMECAVYWVSISSSLPGGDKSTAQSSLVEGWGTLGHFSFSPSFP